LDQSKRKKATVVGEISEGHSASERVAGRVGVFSLAGHHGGCNMTGCIWIHRDSVSTVQETGTMRKVRSVHCKKVEYQGSPLRVERLASLWAAI
jgi:hypothetical protein